MKENTQKPKRTGKGMLKDDSGLVGLMYVAVMLVALVAVFYVAAVVGDKFESSPALQLSATSQWNSTVNTEIVSGRSIWEDNASLVSLAATVSILAIVIGYVFDLGGLRSRMSGGGGGGQ